MDVEDLFVATNCALRFSGDHVAGLVELEMQPDFKRENCVLEGKRTCGCTRGFNYV